MTAKPVINAGDVTQILLDKIRLGEVQQLRFQLAAVPTYRLAKLPFQTHSRSLPCDSAVASKGTIH